MVATYPRMGDTAVSPPPAVVRFQSLALGTLGFTLLVILWGAFVRASGSGAGCGSHWPSCNGSVIPRAESIETVIEFTHRITSGIALLLVVAQLVLSFVSLERGHPARRGAAWSLFFMITEALVGAGIVLFEMVADNAAIARGYWMSAHLMNTFALVAAMSLTVWWSRYPASVAIRRHPKLSLALGAAWALTLVVGVTGAIAALGDTLFPATSLLDGVSADFSSSAHMFLRLRTLHPLFAVCTAIFLLALSARLIKSDDRHIHRLAATLGSLVVAQVLVGLVNLALLAPTWMQLLHLLVADAVWIALVMLSAAALSGPARSPADATP